MFVELKLKKVLFAVVKVTEPEPSGFTLPLLISIVPLLFVQLPVYPEFVPRIARVLFGRLFSMFTIRPPLPLKVDCNIILWLPFTAP